MNQFKLEAACSCRVGCGSGNKDNFFFDGRCLPLNNSGLKHAASMSKSLQREICFAVFDGIGADDLGQAAAFAAARGMQAMMQRLDSYCISEKAFLKDCCTALHEEVLREGSARGAAQMGASMAALLFSRDYVYQCCLGNVRTYRLRGGEFMQLSRVFVPRDEAGQKEITSRFLGMDTRDGPLTPYIAKGELQGGDKYLICSEELASSLTNLEIDDILLRTPDLALCVQELTEKAFLNGAQKSVTAVAIDVIGRSASP